MNWLANVTRHLDYLRDRYEAHLVSDDRDRAGALQVLDEVRRKELNRVHGRSALESAAFVNADVASRLYAVEDTREDRVVGCMRVTTADQIAPISESKAEYHLDLFPPELLARTQVYTRFAILKEYRKTAASLVLLRRLYEDALAEGMLASLLSCEPGLYAGYLRLGFRPLGGVHQAASGGFRIPLVAINHDAEHARRIRSPFWPRLARLEGALPQDALQWYRGLELVDPGVAFYSDAGENGLDAAITQGLTEAGRAALLRNAMEIRCRHGDVVLGEGDGGRFMGVILHGAVHVEAGGRLIAVLGEGELFGEMAAVLDSPRTATVVAAGDDTRVLVLSQTCLERLENPADVTRVWQNLARVLARRLRPPPA